MRKIRIIVVFLSIILFFSCGNDKMKKNHTTTKEFNIYKNNKELRQINDFRQEQKIDELVEIINTKNPAYIKDGLLSLSSICDSNNAPTISVYLKNKNPDVRRIAAFSLGIIKASYFQSKLENAYLNEKNKFVKKQILISLGQTGDSEALNFVASINPKENEDLIMQGQGQGFYFFSKKGLISEQMISKIMEMINKPQISQTAKLDYSFSLTINNNINLDKYFAIINNEVKTATNIYLQINLTKSLKHVRTEESVNLLHSILFSDADYRVKIGALEALSSFNYNTVKADFYKMLLNKNTNISIAASHFFVIKGKITEATKYFNYSKQITSWQARSNMLMAALKYSIDKNKIANSIISGYKVAENKYEKAALLYALSTDPRQYKFVKEQTFNASDKVISTAGIKSLYAMRMNPDFYEIAKEMKTKKHIDIYAEFKIIFKEAMSDGDNAMIYYATKAINNPRLKIIDIFTNTYFISQAMNSLLLPRDIKVYKELCKSIKLYGGDKCKDYIKTKPLEINWDNLASIATKQKIQIRTNKGDFEITLDVNSAPVTVYVFLKLVKNGYYNNTFFYKNILGKAIVNGGKRGDGWMNRNIPLVKEICPANFQDGTVAMSLNGGNFQSINWFISTTKEISYKGKYTIFGFVSKGIDIVHKLEVGDYIKEIKII